MLYNVILFIHVLGTVIMFAAVGITLSSMIAMLYSKKIEDLKIWSSLAVKTDELLPLSVILILLPGLYLVFSTWGWKEAWINCSLTTLIVLCFMGPFINLRRLKRILSAVNAVIEDIPSLEVLKIVRDRVLWNSISIMTMLAIAILFLMTVKPTLWGSLTVIVIAIPAGFITAHILLKGNASPLSSTDETKTTTDF